MPFWWYPHFQTDLHHAEQKLLVPPFAIQGVAVALPNLLRILRMLAPAVFFVTKKNLDLLGRGQWEDPHGSNTPDVWTETY